MHPPGATSPAALRRYAEAIVHTVRQPLLVLDGGYRVRVANPQFYSTFRVAESETIGRRLDQLGNGQWAIPALQVLLEEVLPRDAQLEDFEVTHEFDHVGPRTMMLNARRLLDEDWRDPLILLAIEDVTERRRLAAQVEERTRALERSNTELERFAYVASHDLQEPLRMVASFTQLLAKRYEGRLDSDADEYIRYAVDGANRMKALINDLLVYARVGTDATAFAAISCDEVIQRAMANVQCAIVESGAALEVGELPTVVGDAGQLIQLFQNVLANALKFRHRSRAPVILLEAAADAGLWHFTVQDNGIGIAPEHAERVFLLFQRLHGRADYPGTGIGLALCRRIVERHGGRIWIDSPSDQGTRVHFTLRGT